MSKRPNIIIFNPDQWRGDGMHHLGNDAAVTPNLDELAATDGISFRNAFVQATVCTPSRCSFMTGWYPHTRGHRTMHYMLRDRDNEPNLLRLLKDNGYLVWWGGKNDLVAGQEGYEDHADVSFKPHREDYERWGYAPQVGSHTDDGWRGAPDSDTFYSFMKGKLDTKDKDIYFDHDWAMIYGALDFIASYDGDQPFCMFLPIGYPHPPYCVEDPWYSMIDRNKLPARTTLSDWDQKPSLLAGIRDGQHLEDWTEDRWTELRATYYGMCARVDHQYGLLRDTLKSKGTYDDSAIFIFSDHGDFTGDYGLVEKTQNTLEDCLSHVPLLIKPPADRPVTPGVRDQLIELIDFTATVFELAQIDPGYWHFGRSLIPLFSDATAHHRDAVFTEGGRLAHEDQASERESYHRNGDTGLYSPRIHWQVSEQLPLRHSKAASCRTATHKYIKRYYEQDGLYDLVVDPMETVNIIDDPAYREVLVELKEKMLDWYMSTCDIVPMDPDSRWLIQNKE